MNQNVSQRHRRPRPQIGIAAMMLFVLIFAIISAGLFYAARIPEIQEEWAVLTGSDVEIDQARRGPQIFFILFTLTSPLLLAGLLATIVSIRQAWRS